MKQDIALMAGYRTPRYVVTTRSSDEGAMAWSNPVARLHGNLAKFSLRPVSSASGSTAPWKLGEVLSSSDLDGFSVRSAGDR